MVMTWTGMRVPGDDLLDLTTADLNLGDAVRRMTGWGCCFLHIMSVLKEQTENFLWNWKCMGLCWSGDFFFLFYFLPTVFHHLQLKDSKSRGQCSASQFFFLVPTSLLAHGPWSTFHWHDLSKMLQVGFTEGLHFEWMWNRNCIIY